MSSVNNRQTIDPIPMKPIHPLFFLALFSTVATTHAKSYEATWESLNNRPIPEWFEDAKFGIFIHWGVYSVPAWAPTGDLNVYAKYSEWYWKRLLTPDMEGHEAFREHHLSTHGPDVRYPDFAAEFKAERFEPTAWAELFERAGARYVVLTSKHHDGFALWPSPQSWNWNAVDIGPHRDLLGDLSAAVKQRGLKMGLYYSLYEWFNPLYLSDVDAYVEQHMLPQLKDIVNTYEPEILWADGEWEHPGETWRSQEFLAWLYNDSPVGADVVVNDRWCKDGRAKHGGYYTTEYGITYGDSATLQHPWEECRGIGGSFGYNRAESLEDYQSEEALIHLLIDIVAKGGNLLLNVGPTADGRIPVIMQQRLLAMGEWLEVNGEAIYGSCPAAEVDAASPLRFTSANGHTYVITKKWPGDELRLENLQIGSAPTATLLGSDAPLDIHRDGEAWVIDLSAVEPIHLPVQHAWVVRISD